MTKQTILAEIRNELEANEYRLTPQREVVVQVLLDSKSEHLSAEQIYIKAKEMAPDIGLATVYRTLELLDKLNITYKLESGDGQSRYEIGHSSELHYHHHLICLKCGSISEFKDDLLEEIEAKIAEREDFEITDHTLKFYGYCAKCRGRKRK